MTHVFKQLARESIDVLRDYGVYEFIKRTGKYLKKQVITGLSNHYFYFKYKYKKLNKIIFNKNIVNEFNENCPEFFLIIDTRTFALRFVPEFIAHLNTQYYSRWKLLLIDRNDEYKQDLSRLADAGCKNYIFINNDFDITRLEPGTDGDRYFIFINSPGLFSNESLAVIALSIKNIPESDFLYSDYDHIGRLGRTNSPVFLPDYSPTLFLNIYNQPGYFVCKESVLRRIKTGKYMPEYYFSYFFKSADMSKTIVHIPAIIFHKYEKNITMKDTQQDLSTLKVVKDEINNSFLSKNENAEARLNDANIVINRLLPENPEVTIIIPIRDKIILLQNLMDTFYKYLSYDNYRILIINNNSVEESTHTYLKQLKDANNKIDIIDHPFDFNYAEMMNEGVKFAKSELILFLNNDVEIMHKYWLEPMISYVLQKDVGAVGALLMYPDDTIQHIGVGIGINAGAHHILINNRLTDLKDENKKIYLYDREVSAVTGACMMIRKSLYEEIGGMDNVNFKVAFNDIDLCLKIRKSNYRIILTTSSKLIHHESKSRGRKENPMEMEHLKSKWSTREYYDPYLNINYSRKSKGLKLGDPWSISKDMPVPFVKDQE